MRACYGTRGGALVLVFCVWMPSLAFAQGFGSIGGTIADTSDAVLPGVAVTLSSAQSVNSLTFKTGGYRIAGSTLTMTESWWPW